MKQGSSVEACTEQSVFGPCWCYKENDRRVVFGGAQVHCKHTWWDGGPFGSETCVQSGFAMDAGTGCIKMVMVPRGAQQVRKRARGTKEQVTVNAACNAAGEYMFPFLLFPGKIMTRYIGFQDFPKVLYGCSENGWMTTKNWNDWLYHFNMFMNHRQIKKPVILFVDHYGAHVNREATEFCRANDIILHALLRNATFVMQPFDIRIFSEMKTAFKNKC